MTVALVAVPATVAEIAPGLDMTVKLVAASPADVHRTVADRVPGVTDTAVGAPGGEMAALATGALATEEAATHATAKTAPANRRKLGSPFLPSGVCRNPIVERSPCQSSC